MPARNTAPAPLWLGLLIGAFGLAFVLVGADLLPLPGGEAGLHAPLWIVALVGLIFLMAGLSVVIQAVGGADAGGRLPATASPWLHAGQHLTVVVLCGAMATIGTWVAVAGEADQFSGGPGFLGRDHAVSVARIAFGFGAALTWLATVALAVAAWRQLRGRNGSGRDAR